jgi:hypothetical protein
MISLEARPVATPTETKTHVSTETSSTLPSPQLPADFLAKAVVACPEVFEAITPRDRFVLCQRLSSTYPTLAEIGEVIGVSDMQVRRIYDRSFLSLWHSLPTEIQREYPFDYINAAMKIRAALKLRELHQANKGRRHSKAAREKLRAAARRRYETPEGRAHLESLCAANVGRNHTEEAKKKMQEIALVRLEDPKQREQVELHLRRAHQVNRGKTRTPATRDKIGKATVRRFRDPNDYALWMAAQEADILERARQRQLIEEAEIAALQNHFEEDVRLPNRDRLLNKLSLVVAKLAV